MSPPSVALLLTLLAVAGVQAMPTRSNGPLLDITSSIKLGRPIFGEKLGPFTAGQPLTLTCSTEDSGGSVSLSWWEGDTELPSLVQYSQGIISSSFTIDTLTMKDNGRSFVCQDQGSLAKKAIKIFITADDMEIVVDGRVIKDGEAVERIVGEDLTAHCVVQGYDLSAGSWWEGETQLKATVSESTYARSSELSIQTLTVDDSGRSFRCRAHNGQLSRTLTLAVAEDVLVPKPPKYLYLGLIICIVVLLLLFTSVLVRYCTLGKLSSRKKAAARADSARGEESRPINEGRDNVVSNSDE